MEKLVKGFFKFREHVFKEKKALFNRLSSNQSPRALFITCSDSRVDPIMLTQTDPGELFILRNAGNMVPPYGSMTGSSTATIEYAMAVLKIPNIIVCGHTDCGVMRALLNPDDVNGLPALRAWVGQAEITRRLMQEHHVNCDDDECLNIATQENVRAQLDNLRTHPSVAVQLRKGEVKLHGWIYSISTGEVWVYDFDEELFVPLTDDNGE